MFIIGTCRALEIALCRERSQLQRVFQMFMSVPQDYCEAFIDHQLMGMDTARIKYVSRAFSLTLTHYSLLSLLKVSCLLPADLGEALRNPNLKFCTFLLSLRTRCRLPIAFLIVSMTPEIILVTIRPVSEGMLFFFMGGLSYFQMFRFIFIECWCLFLKQIYL